MTLLFIPADIARETFEVEDPVPSFPDQVQGTQAQSTPVTLGSKPPATKHRY